MQTVSLSWQHSGELAAGLAVVGSALALARDRRLRAAGAFARETAVIAVLYGLWQLAGDLSTVNVDGAFRRGRWIARFEHDVFLPSEHGVQRLILGHPLIVQGVNLYYDTMHFTMMFVFLIWLFVRHRDRYRPVRQVMAWTTLACLVVQLVPVSPPRLTSGLGIVDTAMAYGQSVYAEGSPFDQLSAMPSVHVAWAVLVGWYTWRIAESRWRWLGPAHSAMTVFVVVSTGNHWWLDGIVATALLAACAWGVAGARAAWRLAVQRWGERTTVDHDLVGIAHAE
ncbi:phosphatase PAP2 family protein [uncultured Jatrophihabitans sp.]|uniref:phosphatase PAP2 family protein n=1 Tax=uncultured Jatrophihabitans sp. TaxID=1610747 RepID=UPI0035CB402F